jgi:antirestriction protein ArdC
MNTYEIVSEKIISLLEAGIIPWRKSWASTGLPRNLVSKKPYRGPEESEEKTRRRFLLSLDRVFNIEQCELPQPVIDKLPKIEMPQHDSIDAVEKIVARMPNPPEIVRGGAKAFYSPATDRITLPPWELLINAEEEALTKLHELVHSTGAEKRLARDELCEAAPFGSPVYSKEELTAEYRAA